MRPSCLVAPLAILLSVAASAQPLSYTLIDPSAGLQPSPRIDGTIAYDPASRQLFLFGGSGDASLNDLWSFSVAQRRWTQLQPQGEIPPARFGHTLIFDAARRRLILFGGQSSGFFNDTWGYEIDRNQWRRLAADGSAPSRRYGHSAIHDAARNRMIVSHGFTNSGRFDDTWEFNLDTDTWGDISPSSGRPLRRCLHHAAYDAARNQMLLYGGCASGFGPCPLGDLWSFDLATHRWTEIATAAPAPPARQHYGLAFDSVLNRLRLFGGEGPIKLSDTWEFDPQLRAWRETPVTGPAPAARSRHQGAFASDRGVAFFFGGATATGLTNELWMLGPGFIAVPRPEFSQAGVVDAFSGLAGALAPGEIVSIYGAGLGPIDGFALSIDAATGQLPTSGPGVAVSFSGIAAPLYFVSATQINVQAPYELQGSTGTALTVTVNGATSESIILPVMPTRPSLFPRGFHADGSEITAANPAAPAEIVVMYATGQGATNPISRTGAIPSGGIYPEPAAPTTLMIGGRPAEMLFQGQAPGTVGVLQLNARIPAALMTTPAAPVVLRIGGGESQAGVAIPIR